MTYYDRITEAMTMLAREHNAVFVGQSVLAGGTGMTKTLEGVPREQKIEVPVFEDTQLGMCTGLALDGALPVCIFPRVNFLLLAMNQLVLHLDALPLISGYRPKVIIRTMVATSKPLDPGPQHLGDYSESIREMLKTVGVYSVSPRLEVGLYREAALRRSPSIMVEYAELYDA